MSVYYFVCFDALTVNRGDWILCCPISIRISQCSTCRFVANGIINGCLATNPLFINGIRLFPQAFEAWNYSVDKTNNQLDIKGTSQLGLKGNKLGALALSE